jgi:hypothetical protein
MPDTCVQLLTVKSEDIFPTRGERKTGDTEFVCHMAVIGDGIASAGQACGVRRRIKEITEGGMREERKYETRRDN